MISTEAATVVSWLENILAGFVNKLCISLVVALVVVVMGRPGICCEGDSQVVETWTNAVMVLWS